MGVICPALIIEDLLFKERVNVPCSSRSVTVEQRDSVGLLEEIRDLWILFALRNIPYSTYSSKVRFKFFLYFS